MANLYYFDNTVGDKRWSSAGNWYTLDANNHKVYGTKPGITDTALITTNCVFDTAQGNTQVAGLHIDTSGLLQLGSTGGSTDNQLVVAGNIVIESAITEGDPTTQLIATGAGGAITFTANGSFTATQAKLVARAKATLTTADGCSLDGPVQIGDSSYNGGSRFRLEGNVSLGNGGTVTLYQGADATPSTLSTFGNGLCQINADNASTSKITLHTNTTLGVDATYPQHIVINVPIVGTGAILIGKRHDFSTKLAMNLDQLSVWLWVDSYLVANSLTIPAGAILKLVAESNSPNGAKIQCDVTNNGSISSYCHILPFPANNQVPGVPNGAPVGLASRISGNLFSTGNETFELLYNGIWYNTACYVNGNYSKTGGNTGVVTYLGPNTIPNGTEQTLVYCLFPSTWTETGDTFSCARDETWTFNRNNNITSCAYIITAAGPIGG